jgi:hypothetical protein
MCQFEWGRECTRASWNIGKGWKDDHLTHSTHNFLVPPPPKTKFYLNDLAICAKGEKQKGKIDGDQIVMNKQKGLFTCSTCFYHALQVETQRLFSGCS